MKLLEREMIKFMRMCETEMKETGRIKREHRFTSRCERCRFSPLSGVCVSVEFISLKVIQ